MASLVHVRLPAALMPLFPEATRYLDVEADTVAGLIDALDQRWPGMGDRLRDSSPAIRRHINVFVDGERLALTDELTDGADVFIMTAVSGG